MKKKIHKNIEISDLINKYIQGQCDESDIDDIQLWINESPTHEQLLEDLLTNAAVEDRQKIINKIDLDEEWGRFQSRVVFLNRRWSSIVKYAAIFLIPIAIGSYILFQEFSSQAEVETVVEIAPGIKKAQLILGNGERIDLSNEEQQIEIKGKAIVAKTQNQSLSYVVSAKDDDNRALEYNQLLTGTGEEYKLVLSDGTTVWLNSKTKLKYPTQFASNLRVVELEGEACFEVTKNANAPFIVKTGKMDVEVLGTTFNITAYNDAPTIKTTLIEGKVKIRTEGQTDENKAVIIKPNDQAAFNTSTNDITVNTVDAQVYIAWTKGLFAFDEASLEDIMTRLSRWYDLDVSFEENEARFSKFSGRLPRFEDCNVILRMIEKTTNIKFSIEQNKEVTVGIKKI
nr:FecR family protein [uncultured Draconibacterium sp.]